VFVPVFSTFATAVDPGYPGQERKYLTPEEISVERFVVDHAPEEVYTEIAGRRDGHHIRSDQRKREPLGAAGRVISRDLSQ
jgi:hypothetical protein